MQAAASNSFSFRAESFPHLCAAVACSLAVAGMAVFGNTEGLSRIPQAISVLAVGLAFLAAVLGERLPGIHLSVMAYIGLVAFWGLTMLEASGVSDLYQRFLKLSAVALAAHIIFRTPRDLLLLFGIFGSTGLVNVALNWGELSDLSAALSGGEEFSAGERFAGTFGNANTAGLYATTTLILALIFFFNARTRLRWLVLLSGAVGGLAVVYFTGSRKSMLALGLTGLFVPWMAAQKGGPGRLRWVRWVVLSAGTLAFCALLFSKLPYTERLLVQLREGIHAEASSDTRADMLASAIELWRQYPLFGCGFEGFARLSGFEVYSHSTLSEVLCNAGVFGMILLGFFYIFPGVQLLRLILASADPEQKGLRVGLLALWLQLVLFSLFGVMYYSGESLCIYMAICGYLQAQSAVKRRPAVAPRLFEPMALRPAEQRLPPGH